MKKRVLIIAVVSGLACFSFFYWNCKEEDGLEGVLIERKVPQNGVVFSVSALEGTRWSYDKSSEGYFLWIEFYKDSVIEHEIFSGKMVEKRFGTPVVKKDRVYRYYLSVREEKEFDCSLVGSNTTGNYLMMEDSHGGLRVSELYWMTPENLCIVWGDTLLYTRWSGSTMPSYQRGKTVKKENK